MRAFTSEWVKLSRPTTLVGFGGTMIGFTLLFTILAFESAGGRNIDLVVTTSMLSMPEGSVFVVTDMAVFLGIVALALFASNLAGEFHKGTIRMLFVTEPNRLKVLADKVLALTTFVAAAIAATLAVSIAGGALMASRVGVETAAWWTTDGVAAIAAAYINITAAATRPEGGSAPPGRLFGPAQTWTDPTRDRVGEHNALQDRTQPHRRRRRDGLHGATHRSRSRGHLRGGPICELRSDRRLGHRAARRPGRPRGGGGRGP